MEHRIKAYEFERTVIEHCNLGVEFYRKNLKDGGVRIYVHESLNFTNINLQEFGKEQDIEVCAMKLNILTIFILIISIYRSRTGILYTFKGPRNYSESTI
jgi:hypothetical protein